jgi:hypothetical protein
MVSRNCRTRHVPERPAGRTMGRRQGLTLAMDYQWPAACRNSAPEPAAGNSAPEGERGNPEQEVKPERAGGSSAPEAGGKPDRAAAPDSPGAQPNRQQAERNLAEEPPNLW